jgi:hypothetical protein
MRASSSIFLPFEFNTRISILIIKIEYWDKSDLLSTSIILVVSFFIYILIELSSDLLLFNSVKRV